MRRPGTSQVPCAAFAALLLGLSIGVQACGTTTSGGAGGSADEITREQIASIPDDSAYTLIQRLKPRWLRARTPATPLNPEPVYARVFRDEIEWGDLSALNGMSSSEIERIEYINGRDATTRYGTGYGGGVIRVVTTGGAR